MTAIAITSGHAPSPRLDLASVVPGQTIVVDGMSELGSSLSEFISVVLAIQNRGGNVRVTGTPIDTSTLAGAKMLEVLHAVHEFEARVSRRL